VCRARFKAGRSFRGCTGVWLYSPEPKKSFVDNDGEQLWAEPGACKRGAMSSACTVTFAERSADGLASRLGRDSRPARRRPRPL